MQTQKQPLRGRKKGPSNGTPALRENPGRQDSEGLSPSAETAGTQYDSIVDPTREAATLRMQSADDDPTLSRICSASRICSTCGAKNPYQRCSRCRCAFYCSVDCQKKHWYESHNLVCHAPTVQSTGYQGSMFDCLPGSVGGKTTAISTRRKQQYPTGAFVFVPPTTTTASTMGAPMSRVLVPPAALQSPSVVGQGSVSSICTVPVLAAPTAKDDPDDHPASPVAVPLITDPAPLELSLPGTTSRCTVDAPVSPCGSVLDPPVDPWLRRVRTQPRSHQLLHRALASLAPASVTASVPCPTATRFAILSDTPVGVNTPLVPHEQAAAHDSPLAGGSISLAPVSFFGKTATAFHSVTHADLDSQCCHDLLAQQHRLALLEAEVLEQECRELLAPQETPVLCKHPGGLTNEGPGTQYPSRVDPSAATDMLDMQSADNDPAAANPASPVADPLITNPPAPLVLSLTGTTSPPKVDAPVSPHDSVLEPPVDAWLHWVCTRSCARPLHCASASLATASVSASALFPTANWFALLSDTVCVTAPLAPHKHGPDISRDFYMNLLWMSEINPVVMLLKPKPRLFFVSHEYLSLFLDYQFRKFWFCPISKNNDVPLCMLSKFFVKPI
jgi:MYND finger